MLLLPPVDINSQLKVSIAPLAPTNTPTPTPLFFKKIIPEFFDLFSTPSPSPTLTLTPTPTGNVLSTPSVGVNTPTPEATSSVTIEASPSSKISVTITKTKEKTVSKNSSLPAKDLVMTIVIGALILIVLFQSWPKIKSWLHKKTE